MQTREWILASRPVGYPPLDTFRLTTTEVPPLSKGQVRVRTVYLSVDPYMRGRMRQVRSYVEPYALGEPIEGDLAGRVEESQHADFKKGDCVVGRLAWREVNVVAGERLRTISDEKWLSASLGVLGMPGMTAYFGLLEVGQPALGETVLVSSAAGAVGSLVGPIAKIKGCRAVGIAGSDEKCRWLLDHCQWDAAINYKKTTNLKKALRDACPSGVDVYFDNVGGEISDAAVTLMNRKARVVVCGQMSLYNREKTETGPRNWLYFLVNRARLEGFLVMDYEPRFPEGVEQMRRWVEEEKIRYQETIVTGFEKAPDAFLGLFRGDNVGKQLVKVSAP